MRKVTYDTKRIKEALPVKVGIKKKFGIIPLLEQRKTTFLIQITRKEEELPERIHCYLITPNDEDIIHTEDFLRPFKETKVEVVFQHPGYYSWCCGSNMQSTYTDSPPMSTYMILNIVGYKSFRVYSIFELITVIGAFAAIIAAITGIITLFNL